LGTAGTKQTSEKAAKSWQDEAAVVHKELCEGMTTLTCHLVTNFLSCSITKYYQNQSTINRAITKTKG